MKHIKTFDGFLNESSNQGKIGNVSYMVDPPIMVTQTGPTIQEYIEGIIDDLGLVSGDIEFDAVSFSVQGTLKNGKKISVYQDGEFDKYGGPYDPKMEKAEVYVNNADIYAKIEKEFKDWGWDGDIDITRTDIWGSAAK